MTAWNERYPVAIDLSDGPTAAALQVASGSGVPVLRACRHRDADETGAATASEDDCVSFIRDVVRDPAFKGKSIALLPPPGMVLSYPLRVTVGRDETFEAAIVREARGVLDIPLEEAVLDYMSEQPDPAAQRGGRIVALVAMRRADVERCLGLAGRGGGVLESIEPPVTVLLRVHKVFGTLDERPTLLAHIGRSHSTIAVATRDSVVAWRDIPWGTDGLRAKLADNLELEGKRRDADFLLHKHGIAAAAAESGVQGADLPEPGNSGTVSQFLVPLVDGLTHEFHTVMGYVRSSVPGIAFGGCVLYGDGACVTGLADYLARELNLAVEARKPLQNVAMSDGRSAPTGGNSARYDLAFGLGLRKLRWL